MPSGNREPGNLSDTQNTTKLNAFSCGEMHLCHCRWRTNLGWRRCLNEPQHFLVSLFVILCAMSCLCSTETLLPPSERESDWKSLFKSNLWLYEHEPSSSTHSEPSSINNTHENDRFGLTWDLTCCPPKWNDCSVMVFIHEMSFRRISGNVDGTNRHQIRAGKNYFQEAKEKSWEGR